MCGWQACHKLDVDESSLLRDQLLPSWRQRQRLVEQESTMISLTVAAKARSRGQVNLVGRPSQGHDEGGKKRKKKKKERRKKEIEEHLQLYCEPIFFSTQAVLKTTRARDA